MKILHVIATADPMSGGPIEGVNRIGDHFRARGHQQDLVTLDPPDAPFLDQISARVYAMGKSWPTAHDPVSRVRRKLRFAPRAFRWLRDHARDYDAIIVNGLWNYSTHISRRVLVGGDIPYVVYTHGMLDPWFKRAYPIKNLGKQFFWWWNEGVLINNAAAVLSTCEEERRLAHGTFTPWRAREKVVSYGTADAPPASDDQRMAFERVLPLLAGRPFFLYLSRIHEKKGCDILIDGFAAVADACPDYQLVIAGPGDPALVGQLQAQARTSGFADRIHWPGMLSGDAKWGAFRACEAFVLPSHQENFGIVVAEAMACARPVLISDQVNICREVAAADAGLVAPDTVEGTQSLFRGFLALPPATRATMGERARATFLERFEIGRAASDLLDVLEALPRRSLEHVRT